MQIPSCASSRTLIELCNPDKNLPSFQSEGRRANPKKKAQESAQEKSGRYGPLFIFGRKNKRLERFPITWNHVI
ncbi:hypothetical protein, partial [Methylocystis sp. SB2]|uniref:hypothetical protein n=1 Tax=Methylocystis sp. (strain SB2) TaxID=743836 RepID=UPI000565B807